MVLKQIARMRANMTYNLGSFIFGDTLVMKKMSEMYRQSLLQLEGTLQSTSSTADFRQALFQTPVDLTNVPILEAFGQLAAAAPEPAQAAFVDKLQILSKYCYGLPEDSFTNLPNKTVPAALQICQQQKDIYFRVRPTLAKLGVPFSQWAAYADSPVVSGAAAAGLIRSQEDLLAIVDKENAAQSSRTLQRLTKILSDAAFSESEAMHDRYLHRFQQVYNATEEDTQQAFLHSILGAREKILAKVLRKAEDGLQISLRTQGDFDALHKKLEEPPEPEKSILDVSPRVERVTNSNLFFKSDVLSAGRVLSSPTPAPEASSASIKKAHKSAL